MNAADQSQTDVIVALLARVADAVERSEAVQSAMLAELRRARGSSEIDLYALLSAVWVARKGAVWCVAELREAGLVEAVDARRVGQALARLVDEGGRSGALLLHRHENPDRAGRVWYLGQV